MCIVKSIEDYRLEHTPHTVQEVVCLKCLRRWICVKPEMTLLKDVECPQCGDVGYVIATGQDIEAMI
jgi:hypothetical protein